MGLRVKSKNGMLDSYFTEAYIRATKGVLPGGINLGEWYERDDADRPTEPTPDRAYFAREDK